MISKSGFLNRQVSQMTPDVVHIDNFPGGPETFGIIVKFCYGSKIENTISPKNIVQMYCAARFLEMTEDLGTGNLVRKAEDFLSLLMFSSTWKDLFLVLRSCESVSPWAETFGVAKRCAEAIAWNAYVNPKECVQEKLEMETEDWWFEDVSCLRIDHFSEVIGFLKKKGMRSEIIISCIARWTSRWFSRVIPRSNNGGHGEKPSNQRNTVETLISLLPPQETSASCNFLLHLLKLALAIRIRTELVEELEIRVASVLDKSLVSDLMVKNLKENGSVYDAAIIARVLKRFFTCKTRNLPGSESLAVGRLVDEYLCRIARDEKLEVMEFRMILETLPENARSCHNSLYRAIDMYLKTHPEITEEEKLSIIKAMEYNKLSREARQHVMKNDRLPVEINARFLLVEQVTATKSITAVGSDCQRTKSQAAAKVGKFIERSGSWMKKLKSDYEIKMMKKEVENMKVQLESLEMCKVKIQRHVKRCVLLVN
ncbi:PREDICTED: root phototropism protein 3-like isoform X2 [Tarenaya hassleriana]|nr:PREDICTED: root phototropism protein 3-like isoform X2 [Tarenaya hassleriana]